MKYKYILTPNLFFKDGNFFQYLIHVNIFSMVGSYFLHKPVKKILWGTKNKQKTVSKLVQWNVGVKLICGISIRSLSYYVGVFVLLFLCTK